MFLKDNILVKLISLIAFIGFTCLKTYAQDIQYSQFYNNPLALNPAFVGTGDDTRIGTNFRSQWSGIGNSYNANSFWIDHDLWEYKSGVGLIIQSEGLGDVRLKRTEIGALYSYQIWLNNEWTLKPGIQLSYANLRSDFSNIILGNQIDNNGLNGLLPIDAILNDNFNKSYLDIHSGMVLYNSNFWAGASLHHINHPNLSITDSKSRIPMKLDIHTGYKYIIGTYRKAWGAPIQQHSITPVIHYKKQGTADQFDAGLYYIYEPFMAGLWYRGLPIKKYDKGLQNNEAIIAMVGIYYMGFSFGYSYDMIISQLSGNVNGAHELSLNYTKLISKSQKRKKMRRALPCPKVEKQYRN